MNRLVIIVGVLLFYVNAIDLQQPVFAQGADCSNGLIQQLSVGVRGWNNLTPPLNNVRVRQTPSGEQVGSIEPGDVFTVVAGPQCSDGYSWWQISSDTGVFGWIAEGDAEGYFVDPVLSQVSSTSIPDVIYVNKLPDTNRLILYPPTSAPIVDANAQIGFASMGGGGGDGCVDYTSSEVVYGRPFHFACFSKANLPTKVPITYRIIDPLGNLVFETTEILEDFYDSDADQTSLFITNLPNYLEAPAGQWMIDFVLPNRVFQDPFEVGFPDGAYYSCENGRRVIVFGGFPTNSSLTLNLGSVSEYIGDLGLADMKPEMQWTISVDSDGTAVVYISDELDTIISEDPSKYRVWIEGESIAIEGDGCVDSSRSDYPIYKNTTLVLNTIVDDTLTQQVMTYILTPETLDEVNLYVTSDDFDPKVTIVSEDGIVIAQNDEAETPRYRELDSEIKDVILMPNDDYSVIVESVDSKIGNFTLIYESSK